MNNEIIEVPEETLDEYEESAKALNFLFNQFKVYGYKLAKRKKKSPIRVLEAFLFYGLHDVKLHGQDEEDLLLLCRQVMIHKNKLLEYVIKTQEQQNQKKEEETPNE